MEVLNGFSRKGQRVNMTCCQGSRRFYGLWLFILWEEQTAAATVSYSVFRSQNTVGYSNPVESFRHVLVAKNTINRYHK